MRSLQLYSSYFLIYSSYILILIYPWSTKTISSNWLVTCDIATASTASYAWSYPLLMQSSLA